MIMGDKDVKDLEPKESELTDSSKIEKWTTIRCGWHWISLDLLLTSIGLAVINFSDYFDCEATLLRIIAFYYLCYAIVWLIILIISKQFPKNFIKLGQWILLLLISALVYWGSL